MEKPLVSINLVLHKERSFFDKFLNSIKSQDYENIEINELDSREDNIGFWAGQEKLLSQSKGKYIICMSDVVLDPDFVSKAVEIMEKDDNIGALQGKILQPDKKTIDSTGFQISRSRRVTNRGQGDEDKGQYREGEIFAVEGAVPIFRKTALEDCRMSGGWIIDPDYRMGPLGYGDDLDLTWRMHMLGWKQWYSPRVVAVHDRSTTRNLAKHWWQSFDRRKERSNISIEKRRLDWVNVRFTIIKNDYIINLLKDSPFWIVREIGVLFYMLIFEPRVLQVIPRFFKLLPCILRRRKILMKKAKILPDDFLAFYL